MHATANRTVMEVQIALVMKVTWGQFVVNVLTDGLYPAAPVLTATTALGAYQPGSCSLLCFSWPVLSSLSASSHASVSRSVAKKKKRKLSSYLQRFER